MTEKTVALTDERQAYYDRIAGQNMRPLWELLRGMVTKEPRSHALAALWDYATVRPALMEAGHLVNPEEAERRVLVLENPGLQGQARTTQSLYAGLQLVLPGERAPNHRHTQNALRFVLEGHGAFTSVDGTKIPMEPGDFVVTPNWTWHEHVNTGDVPVVWLDGLDVPLVALLDASFAEDHPVRAGSNADTPGRGYGRTCHFPYRAARLQLEALRAMGPADPALGWRLRYRDPVDGQDAIVTMATFLQYLQAGFDGSGYRSTDGTVFAVVEGAGTTRVGDRTLTWRQGDVFVVPAWSWFSHRTEQTSILFSFSDRPIQEAFGLWREQRNDQPEAAAQ